MSPIARQTAGPNGLKFFVNTHGWPGVVFKALKNDFSPQFYFVFTCNAGPFS